MPVLERRHATQKGKKRGIESHIMKNQAREESESVERNRKEKKKKRSERERDGKKKVGRGGKDSTAGVR